MTIGLEFGPIADDADCEGDGDRYARRLGLEDPIGNRQVVFGEIPEP